MHDVVEPEVDALWECASTEALNRTIALARRGLRATFCSVESAAAGRCLLASDGEHAPPSARTLAVSIHLPSGRKLGTLRVADEMARDWTNDDASFLGELAASLGEHVGLRYRLVEHDPLDVLHQTDLVDISHELRTPLQAIVGFTEFLQTETRRDLIVAHARTIQAAAKSVLGIINQTLDGAGEASTTSASLEAVDLRDFAETCLSMVGPLAIEKRLTSVLVIRDEVPPRVTIDRQKTFQALLNLLNNAVKFTDRGRFTLDIGRTADGLRFSVSDTGIGIAAEKRDLLFQRFSRLDPNHRNKGGTGLGLAITKSLVESMQGRIGVTSHDAGSTFWFDIPAVAFNGPVEAEKMPTDRTDSKPARILIADDLDLNRKIIADMLSIDGHIVDCVADGAAAVKAASERIYDIILMDMIMPGMDGLAAARAIRALPPPARDVPIVALTANCGRDQLDSCLEAGMNATLTKPMTIDGLANVVACWARVPSKAA